MIGRKELDLHILYVEVTKRGGYEKVSLVNPCTYSKYKLSSDFYCIYMQIKCCTTGSYREEMEGSRCRIYVLSYYNKCFICIKKALLQSSLPL